MAKQLFNNDGSPVKFIDQDVYGADFVGVVKGVNLERRTMRMIGTDESKDRDGDIIRLSGWDLEDYRKNPVFLWAHNYGSVPLAAAEKVVRKREPARMEFDLRYPTLGIYPFADMILNLYSEKIINASSVGFVPLKWNPMPPEGTEENTRRSYGREYLKQALLELSGCAVPSNPNTLQNALKSISFKDFDKEDLVKYLSGDLIIPKPDKTDDILEFIDNCSGKTVIEDETTATMVQVPKEYGFPPTNISIEEDKKYENNKLESKSEEGEEVIMDDMTSSVLSEVVIGNGVGEEIAIVKTTVIEIKVEIGNIIQTLTSMNEIIKSIFEKSQIRVNDSLTSAVDVILNRGYEEKQKVPNPQTIVPALSVESLKGFMQAVEELKSALDVLKLKK